MTITVAVIAAAVSIVGWFATSALSARYDRRRSRTAALQAHTEKQLSELYGPLAFLVYEGRGTFNDLLETLGREYVKIEGGDPSDSEVALWLFWVDNDFMPRNEAIQRLLASNTHLIEGGTLPASYEAFLDHHNNWRVSHSRWKQEGIAYSWHSKVDWSSEFTREVIATFETLLARHDALTGAVARRGK